MNLYTDKVINRFDGEYSWLSNFYPCQIQMFRKMYPSVEHAYQAAKFNNPVLKEEIQERIRSCTTPGKAKRLANENTFLIREDWNIVKYKFMNQLVEYKFTTDEALKNLLLETGDAEIIEGNTWGDTYWGICGGKGENNLGKIIMRIRDCLNDPDVLLISGCNECTW